MKQQKNPLALIAGLITIGIVIGVVMTSNFQIHSKADARPQDGSIYTEAEIKTVQNTNPTIGDFNPNKLFVDKAHSVLPAIVSIYTTKIVEGGRNPFFEFFGQRQMPNDENHNFRQQGSGSGIIISKDGYVLTNNHVVEDMDEIKVQLLDNREFEAELIGRDPKTDIALLKITADELPIAVLGNSDNVQIGEWVMAIGNPLNLRSTVTAGIVSAIGRNVSILGGGDAIENFIQTDAAINPGNSGGALINLNGEVIGVNSAIATRTNYYMGYGFAVPINIAKSVIDDLMKYGEVKRGYLGVYIGEVTPVVAKGVGLDKPRGVYISSVIEDRAADKAGIKEGDVILKINDIEVNQPNELQARVGTYNPGEEINVELWRDGKSKKITVVLQSRDGETKLTSNKEEEKPKKELPNLGLNLKNLNKTDLDRIDLDGGVLVSSVDRYSAAADAGIRPGDVIFQLDKDNVSNVDDFNSSIEDHKKGDVLRLKIRNKIENDENLDRLVFLEIPSK
ncbi:MAG: Do family serine endopeptidase [Calditrichae bacterium]|nr:Do family serine endopeptidase [Calditrichota bacterium]MCB9058697.1 Do family serine endopeptidase [Calditrichia bacterium]